LVVLLISIVSIIFVYLHIFKINIVLGFSDIFLLALVFQILVIASTSYIVVALPTYPIYFIILKEKEFNSLEKLNFTIVSNLAFYILTGYIGYYLGFPITASLFFVALLASFLAIISFVIIAEQKYGFFFKKSRV